MNARLFLALFLCTVAAQAGTATQRLHAFFTEVRTLHADFDQTVVDAEGQTVQTARGTVWLQRPGRFRWDYTQPYEQQLVGDGRKVWFYDTDLEQVTVKPQPAALGNSPALLLSGGRPLEESFNVAEQGNREGLDWLELTPRSKDTEFTRVRLGFGAQDLEAMELTDSFGQTTRLRFTQVQRNPALDPAMFNFTPPQGVDVIEGE